MEFIFILLSGITIAGALGVVLSKNSLNSALCLIGTMLGIAGFFALLQSHFLAIAQISVYAGAIMVLVVFVIMLISDKVDTRKKSLGTYLCAGAGAVLFAVMSIMPVVSFFSSQTIQLPTPTGVRDIGTTLFGAYAFPFELTSLLILAAIQGAMMVSRRILPGEQSTSATEDRR